MPNNYLLLDSHTWQPPVPKNVLNGNCYGDHTFLIFIIKNAPSELHKMNEWHSISTFYKLKKLRQKNLTVNKDINKNWYNTSLKGNVLLMWIHMILSLYLKQSRWSSRLYDNVYFRREIRLYLLLSAVHFQIPVDFLKIQDWQYTNYIKIYVASSS